MRQRRIVRRPYPGCGLAAVLCVLGACAGPAATSAVAGGEAVRHHEDAVARLQRDFATQQRRADELEARVALLENEARSVRAGRNGKMTETVVIGGHRPEPLVEQGLGEDPAPVEERPLQLRLHGSAKSRPAPQLEEPMPPVTEKLPVVPLPAATASEPAPAVVAEPSFKEQYAAALRSLRERNYQAAKAAFVALSREFPGHTAEDRITYWWGESAYALREYAEAAGLFEKVVERFPNSDKVPDALLKAGFCYRHLGAASHAERYMARVRRDYPGSQAARLASAEGH